MPYTANERRYEAMQYARCGKSGLKLPRVSLGLWHNFGSCDAFDNMRAMLRAAGFAGPVKSPTFSLVEPYPVWGVTLAHFDFYRFEDPIEFEDAGFRDDFAPGTLAVTEWSEKALPYLPDADAVIELEHDGLGRRARLRALTPAGRQIFEALACNAAN